MIRSHTDGAHIRTGRLKHLQNEAVPAIGFGTWKLSGRVCEETVARALDAGYRHIDTARAYRNESDVGRAVNRSHIDRDAIFITTKVWFDDFSPDQLRQSVEGSLTDLFTDYVDLALLHWPNPEFPLEKTIAAMEELKAEGKVRQIGVSNFTPSQLQRAMSCGPIFCNQVEYHPLLDQSELLEITQANNILLTAYCPLAQGEVAENETLVAIADKHGRTAAQIALRWLVEQENVAAIPRSANREHIEDNLHIFDFQLDDEDRDRIERLPKDQRLIDPEFAPDWNESRT